MIGDKIEFVVPLGKNVEYKIKKMYNKDMGEIKEAHGGQSGVIFLPFEKDLPERTLLRRKI